MELGELITARRKAAGLTLDELSARSGVPKGTLTKIVSGATRAPTLDSIRALARVLGLSLGDLDEGTGAPRATPAERDMLAKYRALDGHGREMVDFALASETRRMARAAAQAAPIRPATKVIPLLGDRFAAGRGDPDFGNPWEDLPVPASSRAEFAIHINGDSMEPWLPDGSIAYGVKRRPADGEVAALLVDGEFLCKQVCQDALGNLYLFALNRARRDADQTIRYDSERSVSCFGTILLDRIPLPTDV